LQLAQLYKALGEEDILRGLYAKISPHPSTQAAIEAELISDYENAFKIYDSAATKYSSDMDVDDKPTKAEVCFFFQFHQTILINGPAM